MARQRTAPDLDRAVAAVIREAPDRFPDSAERYVGRAWYVRANGARLVAGELSGRVIVEHYGTRVLTADVNEPRPDGRRAWSVALGGGYSVSDRQGINRVLAALALPVRVSGAGTGGSRGAPGALYLYANRPGVEFPRVDNADPRHPTYARDARDPGYVAVAR